MNTFESLFKISAGNQGAPQTVSTPYLEPETWYLIGDILLGGMEGTLCYYVDCEPDLDRKLSLRSSVLTGICCAATLNQCGLSPTEIMYHAYCRGQAALPIEDLSD
ncbi:MAG: hypothetical protein FJ161_04485 [Gammaproteobacteria bacterium]|nr:hypothetical protein [Gammaproteobacteria bacterium]